MEIQNLELIIRRIIACFPSTPEQLRRVVESGQNTIFRILVTPTVHEIIQRHKVLAYYFEDLQHDLYHWQGKHQKGLPFTDRACRKLLQRFLKLSNARMIVS
eukprot:JP437900.1.p1 GENE.JP437900.1~~JP437900.1.p1  ORF type:complete len:116 (-),score=0.05 JP437900.1:174-479(-)